MLGLYRRRRRRWHRLRRRVFNVWLRRRLHSRFGILRRLRSASRSWSGSRNWGCTDGGGRCGRLMGGLSLAGSQDLGCCLCNFSFQLIELLLDNVFVVRKVSFQPFKSPGIVFGLKVTLEFVKLVIGHLVSQTNPDTHLKRLVDMFKKAVFLAFGQTA